LGWIGSTIVGRKTPPGGDGRLVEILLFWKNTRPEWGTASGRVQFISALVCPKALRPDDSGFAVAKICGFVI
jgi:hypothetical protein